MASCKLPADTVYTMTKTIALNTKTLATVAKDIAALTPKGMAADIEVPFHPGAAKFYKEVGLTRENALTRQRRRGIVTRAGLACGRCFRILRDRRGRR